MKKIRVQMCVSGQCELQQKHLRVFISVISQLTIVIKAQRHTDVVFFLLDGGGRTQGTAVTQSGQ